MKSATPHRPALARAAAALRPSLKLNTPAGRKFLGELARFSTDGVPQYSGTSLAYHAAQDTRFRDFTGGYLGLRSRPEEDMLRTFDRAKIVARGRLMFRNNPYLASLLKAYVQEIGTATFHSTSDLGDTTKSKAYNDAREELLHNYFEDCETGHNLSQEQVDEIIGYEDCLAGEIFIVRLVDGKQQLIPSELCGSANYAAAPIPAIGTFQDGTPLPEGATERDGIVRAPWRKPASTPLVKTYTPGEIIGYRFSERDPLTANVWFTPDKSVVIPARLVWHLYDPDRVEMGRGIPKLSPILNALLDVYETAHARAQQVKNQACLSMWVTKNIDPYGFAEAMRGTLRTGQVTDAATLKTIAESRSNYSDVRAGSVYYGAAGETVNLVEPKPNSQDFHSHYIDLLQVCAACLNGMPIEVGIEGFRSSSYSSARATMNKWKRNVQRIRRGRDQRYHDPLALWQTNRAEMFGDLERLPPALARQKKEMRWGWPALPEIDGLKTALENSAKLAIGATNLRRIYADEGEHYDIEIKQFIRERAGMLKGFIDEAISLGFTPDQARSWALTQVPTGDGRALAALITATGALSDDPGADPAAKKK